MVWGWVNDDYFHYIIYIFFSKLYRLPGNRIIYLVTKEETGNTFIL